MNRRLQQGVTTVLISGCVPLSSRTGQAQGTPAPTVAVALEKGVITQHEPVIVDFTVSNPSPE
jgi:hypothetical protein